VRITASASPDYTRQKFTGDGVRRETYVFMPGKYFDGVTVDRSIEGMPFRRIAGYLAPELARQAYVPSATLASADLLIVVHWGTTVPFVSQLEMTGQTSYVTDTSTPPAGIVKRLQEEQAQGVDFGRAPDAAVSFLLNQSAGAVGSGGDLARLAGADALIQVTDQVSGDMSKATNAVLLGYTRDMRRHSGDMMPDEEERTLRSDLLSERYFIILKAYDLRATREPGRPLKAVWTVHMNMRSPGINFQTAANAMSIAAVDFIGRDSGKVGTVLPRLREGHVKLGEMIIVGEVPAAALQAR